MDASIRNNQAAARAGSAPASLPGSEPARQQATTFAWPQAAPGNRRPAPTPRVHAPAPVSYCGNVEPDGQPWSGVLALIEEHVPFTRRRLRAGGVVQICASPFKHLHILNLGAVKTICPGANGRDQLIDLHLKGDWIGFDGIASGNCACDAYAMDTSEVWSLDYISLLGAASRVSALMVALHAAMSGQLARDRERRLAHDTFSADARVAEFVRVWARALDQRHLRTDQFALRLTRSEIGSYLGMTHETVSRAFTRLERAGLIRFGLRGRRELGVPSAQALAEFVRCEVDRTEACTLQ